MANSITQRYRPEGILGVGPMGKVFTAIDSQTGLKVAFRAFARQPETPDQAWETTVASMTEHLQAARALDHPRLAKIYDFGREGDYFLIVSEWFDGEALRLKLDRGERYELNTALELVGHVGRVLEYAAEEGVIHGDVTPYNLIVTRDGSIHVVNYGLGILRPRSESVYRAPEQIQGAGEDSRSDMFALGILLYEMVTGEHPFAAATPAEVQQRIVSAPAPVLPGASKDFQAILVRLLEKAPEKRYTSWAEVAVDIAAWRFKNQGTLPRFATENIDPREIDRIEAARAAAEAKLKVIDGIRRETAEKEKRKARSAVALARVERVVRWSFAGILVGLLGHAVARRMGEHSLTVHDIKGEVLIARAATEKKPAADGKPAAAEKPVGAKNGERLGARDTVRTGVGGTTRLAIGDGSQLLLGPESVLTVRQLGFQDGKRVRSFALLKGRLHVLVRHRPRQQFVVGTAGGRVTVKGTQFFLNVAGPNRTEVRTLQGLTEVENDLGKKEVPGGSQLLLVEDVKLKEPSAIPSEVRKQAEEQLAALLKAIPQGALAVLDGLDDAVFTQVADVAQGLGSQMTSGGDDALKKGGAVAKAQGAMQALVQAMEAGLSDGDGGYPKELDLKTLAQISPSNELRKRILEQFKDEKLDFYRPLKDGYEMGARARDDAGTLVVARNGKVTLEKSDK